MTRRMALSIIESLDDENTLTKDTLAELFIALYERCPDAQDEENGLWSLLCCAAEEDPA